MRASASWYGRAVQRIKTFGTASTLAVPVIAIPAGLFLSGSLMDVYQAQLAGAWTGGSAVAGGLTGAARSGRFKGIAAANVFIGAIASVKEHAPDPMYITAVAATLGLAAFAASRYELDRTEGKSTLPQRIEQRLTGSGKHRKR